MKLCFCTVSIFILVWVYITPICACGEKPVKLYKEESSIALGEGSLDVRGTYFFENRTDFELDVAIFCPIHTDDAQPFPGKVTLLDPRDPVPFEKEEQGIQWSQHFEPSGIETVLVSFVQAIEQNRATYILKRKVWGEKIDKFSIIITAPLSYANISISIEPDSLRSDEHKQYYYITKRYFEAKQDLVITWE
jgi:hypothetical protein